jgi:hypothetical protein
MCNNICRGYEVYSRAGHNTGLLQKIHYILKRKLVAVEEGSRSGNETDFSLSILFFRVNFLFICVPYSLT